MSQPLISARTEPRIQTLVSLLQDVSVGKIRVPRFQRPFVWPLHRQVKLLESIRKDYPIGSILLWATPARYSSMESVGGLPVPGDQPAQPGEVFYLLDGHQRISTLYGALRADLRVPENRPFRLAFDCEQLSFKRLPETPQPKLLPLHLVMHSVAFSQHWDEVKDRFPKDKVMRDKINGWHAASRLLLNIGSYQIPVVYIKDAELNQAVEIFSLLNSTGVRVSKDRIFSALSYSQDGFDLGTAFDRLYQEILNPLGYQRLNRLQVLRTMLAALDEDMYSENLEALSRKHRASLEETFNSVRSAVKGALTFLREDLKVTSARLLPYGLQFVALSEFWRCCPQPTESQLDWLRRWFWASSFQEGFFIGNTVRYRGIIQEIQEMAREGSVSAEHRTSRLDTNLPPKALPRRFLARSSRVRATVLMMLSRSPLSIKDGSPYRRDSIDGLGDVRVITHPSDVALRHRMGNRIVCAEESPRELLESLEERLGPKKAAEVLRSHCLDDECLLYLFDHNDREFIRHREELLRQLESEFLLERGIAPPASVITVGALDTDSDEDGDESDADEEDSSELSMGLENDSE